MAEKNKLTKQGKQELEERLDYLVNVEQPKANEELNFARSQGDLSENSDYDAAREKTEAIKAEIAKISHILDHCEIIEDTDDNSGVKTARLGGGEIVVVNTATNVEYKFIIVGSVEADPIHNKISNTCPVAQAIIGKKVGDVVTVNVKKPYELKIIDIA